MNKSEDNKKDEYLEDMNDIERMIGNGQPLANDQKFDEYLNKCLSMVMHHPEIKQIVEVIKKVKRETNN